MKEKVTFITNLEPGGITTVLHHLVNSKAIQSEFDLSFFYLNILIIQKC
ncbi:hypothetical protein [Fructilactobacillus sanfranciscensis]|nr:hypothetical protein [Fructilactobacillus sanfranciscensis]